MTEQLKQRIEGWFATSFWVDAHYTLAALGTLTVFAVYAVKQTFDAGFSGFVVGLWVTAVGNDRVNMPTLPPVGE